MADPKIKIKRGTGKPSDWNGVSGATAGELYVDFTNTSFYIGNTFGQAITFGHFVDGGTLGTNSDIRVPTQKAVKSYVDGKFGSLPGATSADILFVRISQDDINNYSDESANGKGIGTDGNVTEFNQRWSVFDFDLSGLITTTQSPTNTLRSRNVSNSIFKYGGSFPGGFIDGSKIAQNSGSTKRIFISYQISFDNYTNDGSGGFILTSDSNPTRRAAIQLSTWNGSSYDLSYLLPSYGTLKVSSGNVLILNGSGIIDMPNYSATNTIGEGYIELVWGASGVSTIEPITTTGNNYRYAGRSTTDSRWSPNHGLTGDIEPGYTTRLIVSTLPL
jgi:hypothetical protein